MTTTFYAYADFEIPKLSIAVKAGEQFTPPVDWFRDTEQEELLSSLKQSGRIGVVFTYRGALINDGERNIAKHEYKTHTAVLPLEER